MKKIVVSFLCVIYLLFSCFGCSREKQLSTFEITFIDVGQGDAALVECDKHYMLIDGGDDNEKSVSAVKAALEEVPKLDILAMSHLHDDHIGGLNKALEGIEVKKAISNATESGADKFIYLKNRLRDCGTKIEVPKEGKIYKLGRAKVKVVDNQNENHNDSLVLLITYGKTRFLFTGDIEHKAQKRIANKYFNDRDEAFKIDLMKIPHHGGQKNNNQTEILSTFLRTFSPDKAIISVGENNKYNHPCPEAIRKIEQANAEVYRTDIHGNIHVVSNGEKVNVTPSNR